MAGSGKAGLVLFGTVLGMCLFYLAFAPESGHLIRMNLSQASVLLHQKIGAEYDFLTGGQYGQQRIPKLIHQTYKTTDLPEELRSFQKTWTDLNPEYTYKLYNDTEAESFVDRELPQYLAAYKALPRPVERADFFRYLVVYKYGGVYADSDVHCVKPLADWINPTSRMVVGWERRFGSWEEARENDYVRKDQVLQWTFMAEAGHPALKELCDSIAEHAFDPEPDTDDAQRANDIILERTGPGAFTDRILEWFNVGDRTMQGDVEHSEWVDMMPEIAFGALQREQWGESGVKVIHHFHGSWKKHDIQPRAQLDQDVAAQREMFNINYSPDDFEPYTWTNDKIWITSPEAAGFLPWNLTVPFSFDKENRDMLWFPRGHASMIDEFYLNITCGPHSTQHRLTDGTWTCNFFAKNMLVGLLAEASPENIKNGEPWKDIPIVTPCPEGQTVTYFNWRLDCIAPPAPDAPPSPSPPPWSIPPPFKFPPSGEVTLDEKEDSHMNPLPMPTESQYKSDTLVVRSDIVFTELDMAAIAEPQAYRNFKRGFKTSLSEAAGVPILQVVIDVIKPGSVVVTSSVTFYPTSLTDLANGNAIASEQAAALEGLIEKDASSIFNNGIMRRYGAVQGGFAETKFVLDGEPGSVSGPPLPNSPPPPPPRVLPSHFIPPPPGAQKPGRGREVGPDNVSGAPDTDWAKEDAPYGHDSDGVPISLDDVKKSVEDDLKDQVKDAVKDALKDAIKDGSLPSNATKPGASGPHSTPTTASDGSTDVAAPEPKKEENLVIMIVGVVGGVIGVAALTFGIVKLVQYKKGDCVDNGLTSSLMGGKGKKSAEYKTF